MKNNVTRFYGVEEWSWNITIKQSPKNDNLEQNFEL